MIEMIQPDYSAIFFKTPDGITLNSDQLGAQMTLHERHFVLDFVRGTRMPRPKKILEIGVYEGGSSVHILKTLQQDQQLVSVDLKYMLPDKQLRCGHKVGEYCSPEEKSRHTLVLGADILDCQSMLENIDLCIIDTTHAMPGEFLSFLAIYPHLKNGCVIIIHDIALQSVMSWSWTKNQLQSFNCCINLFASISANRKFILDIPFAKSAAFSNIGALIIDDSTHANIESTVLGLGAPWNYYPDYLIDKYKWLFKNFYSDFCYRFFCSVCSYQENLAAMKQ